MRLRILILAPLMLIAVTGCQTAQYSEPVTSVPLGPRGDREKVSNVLANAGQWRNSGVVVQRGQRYRIRAEGIWQAAPTCAPTGPEGDGMYGLLCPGWDLGRVLVAYPHQKLIGKIGEDGQPFPIGTYHELTADRDGTLFLNINEQFAGVSDNSGSMTVTVSLDTPTAPAVAATPAKAPGLRTSTPAASASPLPITYAHAVVRPDDVAVIIGNGDYGKLGKDVPDVAPAYADADSFRRFAIEGLGIRQGNIIDLRDATAARFASVFGTDRAPHGQLYDWVRPGRSRVWVYYAGHGAPAGKDGTAYLIPADADAARLEINGYPLATLYRNLGQLPARSVTVVLEACFSGLSQAGSVLPRASSVYVRPKTPTVPANVTVISAGAADQVASWEENGSHGLFTEYFLTGMSGKADAAPYGNGDGVVNWAEMKAYLADTLTYYARRYYGRDQTVQIVVGKS